MKFRNLINTAMASLLLMFATCTQAASVSYILDQSSRFDDGVDYLSITLSDDAEEGMLSVTVSMLPALRSLLGDNAGIQALSFNLGDGVQTNHGGSGFWGGHMHREWCGHIDHIGGAREYGGDNEGYEGKRHESERHKGGHNEGYEGKRHESGRHKDGHNEHKGRNSNALTSRDFELPDGWHAKFNRGHDKSSMYDVTVFGRDPQDPLQFFVEGLSIEDILDEFAVRVTGLFADCEAAEYEEKCYAEDKSAYFYGGRLADDPPVVVPLPASVWLLGSGMLGLLGMARRRQT